MIYVCDHPGHPLSQISKINFCSPPSYMISQPPQKHKVIWWWSGLGVNTTTLFFALGILSSSIKTFWIAGLTRWRGPERPNYPSISRCAQTQLKLIFESVQETGAEALHSFHANCGVKRLKGTLTKTSTLISRSPQMLLWRRGEPTGNQPSGRKLSSLHLGNNQYKMSVQELLNSSTKDAAHINVGVCSKHQSGRARLSWPWN